jgi:hypothetical protein
VPDLVEHVVVVHERVAATSDRHTIEHQITTRPARRSPEAARPERRESRDAISRQARDVCSPLRFRLAVSIGVVGDVRCEVEGSATGGELTVFQAVGRWMQPSPNCGSDQPPDRNERERD